MMLQTKYQGSRPCGFRKEDLSCFPLISLCIAFDPEQGHFWSQGYNMNKHGRGQLVDATYQISQHKGVWFQTRRFFHVFPI